MAKMKFDSQKLKQLFKERVELIALGVAGALALLLFATGILIALRTKSQVKDSQALSKDLENKFRTAVPPDDPKNEGKQLPDWVQVPIDRYANVAWYRWTTDTSPKRVNPKIRPPEMVTKVVNDGNESFIQHCQVLPVVGGVYQYEWNTREKTMMVHSGAQPGGGGAVSPAPPVMPTGTQGGMEPAKKLIGQRMVLVMATFPYREQVKDFLKALRLETLEELRAKGALPTFLGLDIERGEPGPDGKVAWKPVYTCATEKGKPVVDKKVEELLKLSPLDTTSVEQLGGFMVHGTAGPLPKLARGHWPVPTLPGINPQATEPTQDPKQPPKFPVGVNPKGGGPIVLPGGQPPGPGAAKEVSQLKPVTLDKLPQSIQDQLKGKIDFWSPFGLAPEGAGKSDWPGGLPGGFRVPPGFKGKFPYMMQPPPQPGGKAPGAKGDEGKTEDGKGKEDGGEDASKGATTVEEVPEKILIRFVDVGLKPGQTYQYKLKVWMKNPNFGKEKEVAYPALAKVKALYSPEVWTPLVTIPEDFQFYVMNQSPLATKLKTPKTIDYKPPIPEGKIPVQIHQFVEAVRDEGLGGEKEIADWVIAERLFIGRGEVIGRGGVEVEMPVWDDSREEFVLGHTVTTTGKAKSLKPKPQNSIAVDFGVENGPVLADFWGGKASDGNVEALILGADGNLSVRNCHEDSALPRTAEDRASNPFAAERQERYDTWRARVREAGAPPSTGGGINLPGTKGPFPPGKGPFPPGKGPFPGKG
jgi:hypothetical protein